MRNHRIIIGNVVAGTAEVSFTLPPMILTPCPYDPINVVAGTAEVSFTLPAQGNATMCMFYVPDKQSESIPGLQTMAGTWAMNGCTSKRVSLTHMQCTKPWAPIVCRLIPHSVCLIGSFQ